MSERRNVKTQLACVRCRKSKTKCDNEPEACFRCIRANVDCVRKPSSQAERAKIREKRRRPSNRFEKGDDSSWENDFSLYSEGNRGWKTPLDHDYCREIVSGQRSSSAPPIQREPAHQFIQEDSATPNSMRNRSREGTNLDTPLYATQGALRRPETSTVPYPLQQSINHQRHSSKASSPPNLFQPSINHQWTSMINTTPNALTLGSPKGPGSGDRPLLDLRGAQRHRNPSETRRKRGWNSIGHVVEGGIKEPRIGPTPVEASLPRDMRMNTILSVSLNGDKPGRAKQKRLGDCKSMAALFAEIARGWEDEGVDEEDCYIEVTYDWKSETDEGRNTHLERDHESGLKELYDEIRENPCWDYEADAWCTVTIKICQKY